MNSSIETVFNGAHSRAICSDVQSSNLLVRFEHWVAGKSAFSPFVPWNFARSADFAQLSIQVSKSDFYLNEDLQALRHALYCFTDRFAYVQALGFSMGGFGALLLSRALRLQYGVLVSPQCPAFVSRSPFNATLGYEGAIFSRSQNSLLDGLHKDMRGVVFYDPFAASGRDMAYAEVLEGLVPRLKLVALPGAGHPATKMIANARLYGKFQASILDPRGLARKVKHLHQIAQKVSQTDHSTHPNT